MNSPARAERCASRRARSASRLLLACLCACVAAPVPRADADTVRLYVPALIADRPGLGFAVASVLGLQVWQTLRKAPTPNPQGLSFGDGEVIWDPLPASFADHDGAEAAARGGNLGAQLVLWGKAYEFGDGVVVQLNLSLPRYHDFRERTPEIWRFGWQPDRPALEADMPARRYSFEPIVLDKAVVERYSRPDALALHASRAGGGEVGRVGGRFVALESAPGSVKVRTAAGQTGWVRLPELAAQRSEVVDFVSGLVRIYRADWQGARELLARVSDSAVAPTALRLDAALLGARAGLLAGLPAEQMVAEMDRAVALSPNARRGAVYQTMLRLSAAGRREGCVDQGLRAEIGAAIDQHRHLFLADDQWLAQVAQVLDADERTCAPGQR
jgi:hypothetical protein